MERSISIEETSEVVRTINVEIPKHEFDSRFDAAVKAAAKKSHLKGFRPGKVPLAVIAKTYRAQINNEVLNELASDSLQAAITENNLNIVAAPVVESVNFGDDGSTLKMVMRVSLVPTPIIKDYWGITCKAPVSSFKEDFVDEELGRLSKMKGTMREVEGRDSVQAGDFALAHYKLFVDDKVVEASDEKGAQVEVGAGKALKEFEEALVGTKRDELIEFNYQFPEDFGHEPLAGKAGRFSVTISNIQELVPHAIDDTLADAIKAGQSLSELKVSIAEKAKEQIGRRNKQSRYQAVLAAILEHNPFEVPTEMVDSQIRTLVSRFHEELSQDLIRRYGKDYDVGPFRESYGKMAIYEVRRIVVLQTISEQESFQLSDDAWEAWLNEHANKNNLSRDVSDYYLGLPKNKAVLRQMAMFDAMSDELVNRALIEEVESPIDANV